MKRIIIAAFIAFLSFAAHAGVNAYSFDDPAQEARFKHLISVLRCLVCQNENLADSNAELATDLKNQVYTMVLRGDSDEKITAYMVNRYGDFVLYNPPVKPTTYVLWIGPFVLMALAVIGLLLFIRKRSKATDSGLNEHDRERLSQLLKDQNKDSQE